MFHYCASCDENHEAPIEGHERCQTCRDTLHWWCPKSGVGGVYRSFYKHRKTCLHCYGGDRAEEKQKKTDSWERQKQEKAEEDSQDPYASWSKDGKLMKRKTGVNDAVWRLLLTSCKKRLAALHGSKVRQGGKLLMTPANQLLLLLNVLREDPTDASSSSAS